MLFWVVLGAGMGSAFAAPDSFAAAGAGMTYQAYFLPGIAAMIVLFTAIFATISVIEDRREGFLQGVLVAPVPRVGIVLGKVLGGAAIAVIQAGLFLALAPLLNLVGAGPGRRLRVHRGRRAAHRRVGRAAVGRADGAGLLHGLAAGQHAGGFTP